MQSSGAGSMQVSDGPAQVCAVTDEGIASVNEARQGPGHVDSGLPRSQLRGKIYNYRVVARTVREFRGSVLYI